MKFKELNISTELVDAVGYMGFEECTPIQAEAIPAILEGKDLIGCAQTGTGKTAAFLIPILEKLSSNDHDTIKTLIIVPTRELASQIDEQVQAIGYFSGVSSINLGYVDLSKLEVLILDEADRMLDMGFIEDIQKIIKLCPQKRQTLMFSATMATQIRVLAKQILHNPIQINLAIAKPAAGVNQVIYNVYNPSKIDLLVHIIKNTEVGNMIVFASRKEMVDQIERKLIQAGISCKSLHSGREQEVRSERLREFKSGKIKILVATDVLSRGIDINNLTHVLNFDMPNDAADYVHRIGRTARADKTGTAISFVNEEDQPKMMNVEELIERKLEKLNPPPNIGEGPDYDPDAQIKKAKSANQNRGKGKGNKPYNKNKGSGGSKNNWNKNKNWKKKGKPNNEQNNASNEKKKES
ncbi:MAG: DEAD/DEAH box helicase [Flavobacteriales bacterium]